MGTNESKKDESKFTLFLAPALSLLACVLVFAKATYDYGVESMESPNFLLVCFTSFPYFLTFVFSFIIKAEEQRKSFYMVLGLLSFMSGIEWILPRTAQLKNILSVVWFFQTIFVVPFLIYSVKNESSTL